MHVIDSLENTAMTWFHDCGNGGGDDGDTLTVAAVQPGPEVLEDVQAFMAAIHPSGYQETIPDGDVVALATTLRGFEGCDKVRKQDIYSGWYQSWELMNFIRPKVNNMDFNSAAAVEYLGPPAIISPYFDRIKGMRPPRTGLGYVSVRQTTTDSPSQKSLAILVTFQSGPWWRVDWFDYKINARCDDPRQNCPCNLPSPTIAYTLQRKGQTPAIINFCPRYFNLPTLSQAMDNGRGGGDVDHWANMNNYWQNQGKDKKPKAQVAQYSFGSLAETNGNTI